MFLITISWNDNNCDKRLNTICKIEKGKTPGEKPTNPPPQGYEDPSCGTDNTWVGKTHKCSISKLSFFILLNFMNLKMFHFTYKNVLVV